MEQKNNLTMHFCTKIKTVLKIYFCLALSLDKHKPKLFWTADATATTLQIIVEWLHCQKNCCKVKEILQNYENSKKADYDDQRTKKLIKH